MFIILEGLYSITAEGETTEAGPGAVVFLPRGCAHAFRNIGETTARHWAITTPCGFESFFAGAAQIFAAPGGPDPKRLVALAAEHGSTFL